MGMNVICEVRVDEVARSTAQKGERPTGKGNRAAGEQAGGENKRGSVHNRVGKNGRKREKLRLEGVSTETPRGVREGRGLPDPTRDWQVLVEGEISQGAENVRKDVIDLEETRGVKEMIELGEGDREN